MANFVFKETKQTAMKIVGILNSNDLTINVDGEEKNYLLFYPYLMIAMLK